MSQAYAAIAAIAASVARDGGESKRTAGLVPWAAVLINHSNQYETNTLSSFFVCLYGGV